MMVPLFVIYFRDEEKRGRPREVYILYTPLEELELKLKANKYVNNLLIKSTNGLYLLLIMILYQEMKLVFILLNTNVGR